MEAARRKLEIQTLDDLFGITPTPTIEVPDGTEYHETVVSMPLGVIRDFKGHPYRVCNDSITQDLVRDIEKTGRIETPAIVRPVPGGYEMISGHRRKLACSVAGLESMPVIVRSMTDDEAVIAMVSANRQREQVLPSEKAFAYKMWMDAIKRQAGRPNRENPRPVVGNLESSDIIGEQTGESGRQVQRYIRLTELIPQLLELVDNGVIGDKEKPQMAFRPAVELSYLTKEQQNDLLQTIESEDRTPSLTQSLLMKELSGKGELDMDKIFGIMREDKPNQKEQFKIPQERLSRFFPPGTPRQRIEDTIIKALEFYRHRDRERDDAR